MARRKISTDLVTIEVEEYIPDILQRISTLHAAFIRVLTGTRLVEVLEADYEVGKLVAIIESRRSHPHVSGKVCVRYKSCPDILVEKSKK